MSSETGMKPSPDVAPDSTTPSKDAVSGPTDSVQAKECSDSVAGNVGEQPVGEAGGEADAKKGSASNRSPGKKSPGGRNSSAHRAATAAALADPESLLQASNIDDVTKQTQCTIPYQRSTFLVVSGTPEEEAAKQPTKASLRTEIWNHMESNNIAAFPRPVYRRIPNFKDAALACNGVAELPQFKNAQTILIGPDRPQQHIRFLALEQGKTLLVPTSRLENSVFNKIVPPEEATKDQLNLCAAAEGVKRFSTPLGLDDKVKIDLVILGSVVVSSAGRRLGKGEGFADLEWAMMRSLEAVDQDTVVVTCVHDCQVKEDILNDLFTEVDLTVDIIVTPTQTLPVREPLAKPNGLVWNRLTPEKLEKCSVLKSFQQREEAAGKNVTLGESVKREIISRVPPENETDKCVQTIGGSRRRARSTTQRSNRGGKDVQTKHVAKVKGIRRERKERRRGKSTGEEEEEGSKVENSDVVKKAKQRRNKLRQRSLKSGKDSEAERETGGEDSGRGGDTSPDEKPRKKRGPRKVEDGRGDAAEERQSGGGRRGGRGGGRQNNYQNNFPPPPPQRYAPPWLHPYNAPPPPNRYGGYYPPPQQGGGRYMYRAPPQDDFGYEEPGFYGPPGRRNPPPGAFYPTRRPAVFVGDIPKDCGEDMFNDMLTDRKVKPYRLIWQEDESRTFLVFDNLPLAKDCLRKLRNLSINDEPCRVDLSNMTKRTYFQ